MIYIKKTTRWILIALAILFAILLVAMAIIRFVIFPNIDEYKDRIVNKISEKIGQKVTIGDIVTGWDMLSPSILLRRIDIYDDENTSALHLANVQGTLSWLSIPLMHAYLSDLSISKPKLTIRRKSDGNIYVAGMAVGGESKPEFANWLLSQASVNVKNATVTWLDDLRQAPPLSLNKLNLTLSNSAWRKIFGQHAFAVSTVPSTGTNSPIKVNGRFYGRDISQLQNWFGKLHLSMQETDLSAWKPWLDYPINLQSGLGNSEIWLTVSKKNITEVKANVSLKGLSIATKKTKIPLNAALFSGLIHYSKNGKTTKFQAQDIVLKADDLDIKNGSGNITNTTKNNKPWTKASFKLNAFNLAAIKKIQQLDLLPSSTNAHISALAPSGKLEDITVRWHGETQQPSHYEIETKFKNLSINAYNNISGFKSPGFKNLSGDIDANQDIGAVNLNTKNALLDFKDILRWPIPVSKLIGRVSWQNLNDQLEINTNQLSISNPHIAGTIKARYNTNDSEGGYLDLSGKFDKGNAEFARFYYPVTLGQDTLDWLDSAIKSGKAEDITLAIKGNLADFPYVTKQNTLDPKLGLFSVTAKISDAILAYGDSWPVINDLGLDLLFEGKRMELNTNQGRILGNKITQCKTTIANLDADVPILKISSNIEGSVQEAVNFVNQSPVNEAALGFTDNLKTTGLGKLSLSVAIPLTNLDASKYSGEYTIVNGSLLTDENIGLPEISQIQGVLNFTESGLSADNVNASILGGPLKLNLNTDPNNAIQINAKGAISDIGIKNAFPSIWSDALVGNAAWSGKISIQKPLINLDIRSNLQGLAIQLPAPFGKDAAQLTPININKSQSDPNKSSMAINYNELVDIKMLLKDNNGVVAFDRGDIAINTPAKLSEKTGLSVHGELDYFNADEWLTLLNEGDANKSQFNLEVNHTDLVIKKLDIFDRSIHGLTVTSNPSRDSLSMAVTSKGINGNIQWKNGKNSDDAGKIIADLSTLHIPKKNTKDIEKTNKDIKRLDSQYPDLDITAEDFRLGNKKFGHLELNAFENADSWVIKRLAISNPDNTLSAEGVWHNWVRNPTTSLNFSLIANDIGGALKRFGQADTVKGGEASITGLLQWPGSPDEFETQGLNGSFELNASKGQVLKVKPGVGRLLGLLSLQSLPRRLTLDFRDLFSEGFAFDKISVTAKITEGTMRSNDFYMNGPAAEVSIKGETNLHKETQNLDVKVVPNISDSLSLAAFAGGPIAGVAAFVAQKILKDPLNKIVRSKYKITGTWDNPTEVTSATKKKPTNLLCRKQIKALNIYLPQSKSPASKWHQALAYLQT